jgi:hypothetical protein
MGLALTQEAVGSARAYEEQVLACTTRLLTVLSKLALMNHHFPETKCEIRRADEMRECLMAMNLKMKRKRNQMKNQMEALYGLQVYQSRLLPCLPT